jgi:aryl-alcohol dehydrogenase-like predicted oxidoreductase
MVERAKLEGELRDAALAEDMGIVPFYGLANGFLTGKYRTQEDLGTNPARAQGAGRHLNGHGLRVLAALDDVARRHDAVPAQVALAWLMARPGITAPIASATSVAQVQELAGAAALRLSDGDLHALDAASN